MKVVLFEVEPREATASMSSKRTPPVYKTKRKNLNLPPPRGLFSFSCIFWRGKRW